MPDYVIQCKNCRSLMENWASRCPYCDKPAGNMIGRHESENQKRVFFPNLLHNFLCSIDTKLSMKS